MRAFHIAVSVAIVISMSAPLNAAQRIRTIHSERARMSEARKRDLVLGDLKSILTGPATPISIATEPYVSSVEGLCQRDVIQLKYESKRDDRADSSLLPIGIRAISVQYHYLGREEGKSRARQHRDCEQLSDRKIYWAFGDDDHHASGALASLKSTVADVQENQRFEIDCEELSPRDIKTSCADIFLSAAEQITSISRRFDPKDESYEFTSSPYQFRIVRTYSYLINGGYSTAIKMRYEDIVVT